jgi:amino acid transporter
MPIDRERAERKVGSHAAWAMAVGGMIGGGIYTLSGVIVGTAGALGWVSLTLGAGIALATVRSYATLALPKGDETVPLTVVAQSGNGAGLLGAYLLGVYVLAFAVYTFTVGHYLGGAFGLGDLGIALCELAVVGVLVIVNLRSAKEPARVQITAVWIELAILAVLAGIGLIRWRPENLAAGVPAASLGGVVLATATTFVAFEGFEMLAYDLREMQRPRHVVRAQLPRAVIAVALAYAIVTVGAASLVGAGTLARHQEHALAIAGRAAAGTAGFIIVTLAACASGISAINATLFSVSRLARASAERGFAPTWCARCNRHDAPHIAVLAIAVVGVTVAIVATLRPLVATTSLGFLVLFCLVNVLALRRSRGRARWISICGAAGSSIAAVVVSVDLARTHVPVLIAICVFFAVTALRHVRRKRS